MHFKGKGRINYANSDDLRRLDGAGHDSEARLPTSTGGLARLTKPQREAAKRGRTNAALSAIEGQRRARAGLAGERNEAAGTL